MKPKVMSRRVVLCMSAMVAVAVFVLCAQGGNLEPSAGPGPTMKRLDEVEPRTAVQSLPGDANSLYVINESGSYYLTGNITGVAGKNGIEIVAKDVALDLMGFSIAGVAGSGDGIKITGAGPLPVEEVSYTYGIRNGTIYNWGDDGIELVGGKVLVHSNSELLNASIHDNAGNGMYLGSGSHTYMKQVSFAHNGGHGLYVDANSCINMEDVSSFYNTGHGAMLGMMTNVDAYSSYQSSFSRNGGDGMHIANGSCSHIEDVSFNNNGGKGMYLGSESYTYMEQVSFRGNSNDGLYIDANSCAHMEDVSFSNNTGHGVFTVYGMLDAFGVLSGPNGGGGIIVGGSGNLNRCTAVDNGSVGIQAGSGSTVRNCAARGNTGDGILVSSNCRVTGSTCENNGAGDPANAAGIHATGGGNRIEANHVINNDRGIDVDTGSNLIIRNSAFGNTTNYDIALGNTAGPVIGDTDIAGDSNPHANYEF